MRSPAALVKVYHKESAHVKDNCLPSRRIPDYLNDPPRMGEHLRNFQSNTIAPSDCLTKQFESSILKEISKNYILIPKLQPSHSSGLTYLNPPTENADADWKSKYNILNELKKSEKESLPDKVSDFIFEDNQKVSSEELEVKQQNKVNDDTARADNLKYCNVKTPKYELNPIKMKVKKQNKVNDDTARTDNLKYCNVKTPKYELNPIKTNSNTVEKDFTDSTADYESHDKRDDTSPSIESSNKLISHYKESYKNGQYAPTTDNNIHKSEVSHQFEPNFGVNRNLEVYNSVENHEIPQEITNMDINNTKNQWEGKSDEQHFDNESFNQNNSEHLNPEFKEDISYNEKIDTRNVSENFDINFSGGFQENSKVENEPELNNIQKHDLKEAPINSDQNTNAEVNELEKEQSEMFYTENSEKYDESNVDNVENSVDNENYTNDQYPYYDESQQEQPYTTEINEHEESTECYDPNYDQQYTENYANVPKYDDQQYEVENSYENQQDTIESTVNYEEVPPSNDNVEHLTTEHNMDISYQNQEATEYNLENENYESQNFDTNAQEYSTIVSNDQGQYVSDQEYIQVNTEQDTVKEMEEELDAEDGYINNQNNTLNDNTQEPISTNISSNKNESSLKVS
ncbi:putative uncharacterized protein DDB_G0282499 [Nymphalis io]|uniref:putative uncharacterized protein DDB_G0282499 n=1 Tax=Inachis io TaxID=171585 RepID=UPI0021695FC3|nr:putative uncharacterized protein DDB_G0282499 [Nymphalis io]